VLCLSLVVEEGTIAPIKLGRGAQSADPLLIALDHQVKESLWVVAIIPNRYSYKNFFLLILIQFNYYKLTANKKLFLVEKKHSFAPFFTNFFGCFRLLKT
jgi:hypothetical protein